MTCCYVLLQTVLLYIFIDKIFEVFFPQCFWCFAKHTLHNYVRGCLVFYDIELYSPLTQTRAHTHTQPSTDRIPMKIIFWEQENLMTSVDDKSGNFYIFYTRFYNYVTLVVVINIVISTLNLCSCVRASERVSEWVKEIEKAVHLYVAAMSIRRTGDGFVTCVIYFIVQIHIFYTLRCAILCTLLYDSVHSNIARCKNCKSYLYK